MPLSRREWPGRACRSARAAPSSPSPSGPRQLEALLDFQAGVDEGADDRLLDAEERDDVEGNDLARVAAADDHPPVLGERVESLLEQLAADVLVDEVDATPLRDFHHLLDHVLRLVVDPEVQAELGGPLKLLVAACVPDHVRPRKVGKLDGGGADPAADCIDQHRLAGLEPPAGEEHVPSGSEGDLDRKSTRLNSSHVRISYAVFC